MPTIEKQNKNSSSFKKRVLKIDVVQDFIDEPCCILNQIALKKLEKLSTACVFYLKY